jgi:glycosyltransferase involved in cell wall biosynthesis
MPGFVNQSQLGSYFAAADVFVLPSEFETWGLVVNEAMYFGLPVIVSDRVGCRHDLVIPGKTGEVFHHGDVKSLSLLLDYFLGDSSERIMAGLKAREHIKKFSVQAAADGIAKAVGAL